MSTPEKFGKISYKFLKTLRDIYSLYVADRHNCAPSGAGGVMAAGGGHVQTALHYNSLCNATVGNCVSLAPMRGS